MRVIFTREKESGDLYIERLIGMLGKQADVSVVTSDGMIQVSALRYGVRRISSSEFYDLVNEAEDKIEEILYRERSHGRVSIGDETGVQEKMKKGIDTDS